MNSSGKYIDLKEGLTVGGYVRRFRGGYSNFHISPHYAMGGDVAFRAVAGHELIHAYHHFTIPAMNSIFSERVAYKFTRDIYNGAGQFSNAMGVYNTAIYHGYSGTYPSKYQIPTPFGW